MQVNRMLLHNGLSRMSTIDIECGSIYSDYRNLIHTSLQTASCTKRCFMRHFIDHLPPMHSSYINFEWFCTQRLHSVCCIIKWHMSECIKISLSWTSFLCSCSLYLLTRWRSSLKATRPGPAHHFYDYENVNKCYDLFWCSGPTDVYVRINSSSMNTKTFFSNIAFGFWKMF